ncbi:MAG: orotidine-5'-phosphate decarboxylase [Campylobacterales bacterium]
MKLVVALDLPTLKESLQLAERLAQFRNQIWMKVGLRGYLRDGVKLIEPLQRLGFPIFLDLKLHDIPNTIADSAEVIGQLGVEMFNLHLSVGRRGVEEVLNRLEGKFRERPLVLGVTILTSLSPGEVEEIYGAPVEEKVVQLAKVGFEGGLDGIVCSVWESRKIKKATSQNFLTLTPGIRPIGAPVDDQRRVATPADACRELADFIVVGRPIYRAPEPERVVAKLLEKAERCGRIEKN